MNKKIIIAVLIAVLFLSACTEKKPKTQAQYEVSLESYDFNFEKEKIELEVYSESELQKTMFEFLNEKKKLNCFGYFDLKKGKNSLSVNCPVATTGKLFLEVTPSDGKTKEFIIEIKPREKISLKKGFEYDFELNGPNIKVDQRIFITDENSGFLKGVLDSYFNTTKNSLFISFMIDKNSLELYSSGIKENCAEAFKAGLKKNTLEEAPEGELLDLIPFLFFYLKQNKDFEFSKFLKEKEYSMTFERTQAILNFTVKEKKFFKGIEVYEIAYFFDGQFMAAFFVQAEQPNIVLYFKTNEINKIEIEFKEEIKKDFDTQKYSCFSD
jgi:hypothetical protein